MDTVVEQFITKPLSRHGKRRVLRAVKRVCDRFGSAVRSAVHTYVPFYKDVLLFITNAEGEHIAELLAEANKDLPQRIRVFCLQDTSLGELATLHPYYPELYSLAFWLRKKSKLLHGEDMRSLIPLPAMTHDSLIFHLTYSTYHLKNRLILQGLTTQDYANLARLLERERLIWMLAALFSKQEWEITPETVYPRFLSTFGNIKDINDNVTEFKRVFLSMYSQSQYNEAEIIKLCWLTERFASLLWRSE